MLTRLTGAGISDRTSSLRDDAIGMLVTLLQKAYSGERAAAYAYAGHWHSVWQKADRRRIREIEEEEWRHRRLLATMLAELGSAPNPKREHRAWWIGRTLGLLCFVTGYFAPMYGAGKLERSNIGEYETAARLARDAGRHEWVDCLLTMAELEWEHELYFRTQASSHILARFITIWAAPPPKANIRASFLDNR